jgi:hypothetical protein
MFDKLLTALRTAVASLIERIRIHKEPEIKGAFKTLQDRVSVVPSVVSAE